MRADSFPHAVSAWMTEEDAQILIKEVLISNGGMGQVVLLVDPSNLPIQKGETSSPGSWPVSAQMRARRLH